MSSSLLSFVLLGVLFREVLWTMGAEWFRLTAAWHGFPAAVIAGWLFWRGCSGLAASSTRSGGPLAGFALLGASVLMLIAGSFVAEFLVSRVAFLTGLAGVVAAYWGWRALGSLWFPLFLLFWSIRIPQFLSTQLVVPMQSLGGEITAIALQLLGTTLALTGDQIELSSGSVVQVKHVFRGLQGLQGIAGAGLVFGYFCGLRIWWWAVWSLWNTLLLLGLSVAAAVALGYAMDSGWKGIAAAAMALTNPWVLFPVCLVLSLGAVWLCVPAVRKGFFKGWA